MYRPTKKKLVRRLSAVSVVALLAAAGLGVALVSQSGATTGALKAVTPGADSTTSSTSKVTASSAPKYRVVPHENEASEADA